MVPQPPTRTKAIRPAQLKAWEWGGFLWRGADGSPNEDSDLKHLIDFNDSVPFSVILLRFNSLSRALSNRTSRPSPTITQTEDDSK
jgi:hypothetical protein